MARPKLAANETPAPDRALRDRGRRTRCKLLEAGVRVFTMKDIDRYGIATVMERALTDRDRQVTEAAQLVAAEITAATLAAFSEDEQGLVAQLLRKLA